MATPSKFQRVTAPSTAAEQSEDVVCVLHCVSPVKKSSFFNMVVQNGRDEWHNAVVYDTTRMSQFSNAADSKKAVKLHNVRRTITTQECIMQLAKSIPVKTCLKCKEGVDIKMSKHGTGLTLSWTCVQCKQVKHSWSSQPLLRSGAMLGNMKLCTGVTLSGNNYQKIVLLFKFINLGIPSAYSFHQVQANYLVPTVNRFWLQVKQSAQEEIRASPTVLSGDGRMDSPGHCAKYCTYTVMDQHTKKIIAMEVVDKRDCQLKSSQLEVVGFQRALADLQNAGIIVTECVTDAHPQISALMKRGFPNIKHSWDLWHGAKNLGKKLCAVSQEKGKNGIKPWISSITNHFYHAAEHCEGNELKMKVKFAEVMNHCANRHEWALGQCDHGPLDDNDRKEWLRPGGPELQAIEHIIMETRFLNTMKYYVTAQTTSELESFNNHILMYAAKRQAFKFSVYKCRCELAAIDYMMHLDRPYKKTKKGEQYYNRAFSKAANQWVVKPVKEKKEYAYISDLMLEAMSLYCLGETKLSTPAQAIPGDPSAIAKVIAPVEPPSTAELVQKLKPRLEKKQGSSK